MSSIRLARALGALGVSGALATGALAVSVSSADAATATTTAHSNYTCTTTEANPLDPTKPTKLSPVAIPTSVTAPVLKAKPGQEFAAIPVGAAANVPKAAADQLALMNELGDTTASVSLPLKVAGSSVPLSLSSAALPTTAALSPLKMSGDMPFAVPSTMKPGYYPVTLPKTFTLVFSSLTAAGPSAEQPAVIATSACTLTKGASSEFGWLTVLNKNGTAPAKPTAISSAKFAHSTVTTKQRAVATVAVKTTAGGGTPTGRVEALFQGKNVGSAALSGGKAKVTLKRLAKGTHTITFKYLGNSSYKAVSKALKLTVKKG